MVVRMSQSMAVFSAIVPELKDENCIDKREVGCEVGLVGGEREGEHLNTRGCVTSLSNRIPGMGAGL